MKKSTCTTPAEYLSSITGWQRLIVNDLRAAVRGAADFEETLKWGHLVYLIKGPALLIRAEDERVIFGFWRGQRLREVEPRLKPGGKYEMASLVLREGDSISADIASRLAREAYDLNQKLGDPRDAAKATRKR